jgi:hypothetical protein
MHAGTIETHTDISPRVNADHSDVTFCAFILSMYNKIAGFLHTAVPVFYRRRYGVGDHALYKKFPIARPGNGTCGVVCITTCTNKAAITDSSR